MGIPCPLVFTCISHAGINPSGIIVSYGVSEFCHHGLVFKGGCQAEVVAHELTLAIKQALADRLHIDASWRA